MKKDIEWLKKWVEEYENRITKELGDKFTDDFMTTRFHGGLSAVKEIKYRINQLDEPETLSLEWIDENKKDSGVHYIGYYVSIGRLHDLLVPKHETFEQTDINVGLLKEKIKALEKYNEELIRDNNQLRSAVDNKEVLTLGWIDEHAEHHEYIGYAGVPVDDLKNLLVPKQELPAIPKVVAEFLIGKEDYMLYELFDDEWLYKEHNRVAKWLYDNDELTNRQREIDLVMARNRGYEVEEEQKYILSINITDKASKTNYETFLNKRGIFHSMDNESFNNEEFNWSEEEIKGLENGEILFEHFAVKVEELE